MNKAFIFDFDGVIIDDESIWEDFKKELYQEIFGGNVSSCLSSTIGINQDDIYEKAVACGTKVKKEVFIQEFSKGALEIYKKAPLSPGIDSIGKTLTDLGYKIGIVSASSIDWIELGLNRTSLKDHVGSILSLRDRKDLVHKPAPDGYLEAMKIIGSSPETTVILEDSNPGIESGKASGAFTIGFRQNLVKGYVQKNADAYANNFEEVIEILKQLPKLKR